MAKEFKLMTEALIIRDGRVLLGRRKKDGFGHGKWLGFGGKVEPGESIEEGMKREFIEEVCIEVEEFEKRGVLTFHYINDPDMEVHYFEVTAHRGEPLETREMENAWFEIKDIPYDEMFPNDSYWLPMFLRQEYFAGEFWFNKEYKIIKHTIKNSSS